MTVGIHASSPDAHRDITALMVAAQAGDRAAYNALLRGCVPIIKSVARNTGAPVDCLDDVVQETLMTLHRARHTYDPNRSFVTWLSVLAQRRTIDVLRRDGRNHAREIHAPIAYESYPDLAHTPEQHMNAVSNRAVLQSAVDSLPAAQREAVHHLAINDETLAEAAAATNRSKIALKVNLHRALATLRARLLGEER